MFLTRPVSAALAAVLLVATTAAAQLASPVYKLHSLDPALDQHALDLDIGSLQGRSIGAMFPTSGVTSQNWSLAQRADGSYQLGNGAQGAGQCVDLTGDGVTIMQPCGAFLGQQWRLTQQGGAIYRIGNDFKQGQCLDVLMAPSRPRLVFMNACDGSPSQDWLVVTK